MRIGILGAGQLSRMLALAGIPLGFEFSFYDEKPSSCVRGLGDFFAGNYTDFTALKKFLATADLITYENENIPVDTLKYILAQDKTLNPGVNAIQYMQDRLLEKNFVNSLEIPTANYRAVTKKDELIQFTNEQTLPVILKARTHSYDGKGQHIIKTHAALNNLDDVQLENKIVEQFINFDREISLVGCRDLHGNYAFYDICCNTHKNGILHHTANVQHDDMQDSARAHLTKIMDNLNYIGVCTAEYFVVGKQLIINELAPRVHNTGHWTIEGAVTSQFENHLRCIAGLPIGKTQSHGQYSMHNILGAWPDKIKLLAQPGLHLHDYRKAPKKNRKVGHINFLNAPATKQFLKDTLE